MTETITINVDSEVKKDFEAQTGLKLSDGIKLLLDNIKYGGKVGLDPFWSEENQKHLEKSICEFDKSKCVSFTAEEWEKYVNAQEK